MYVCILALQSLPKLSQFAVLTSADYFAKLFVFANSTNNISGSGGFTCSYGFEENPSLKHSQLKTIPHMHMYTFTHTYTHTHTHIYTHTHTHTHTHIHTEAFVYMHSITTP